MTAGRRRGTSARRRPSTALLDELIDEATVDAYGDAELQADFHAAIEEHLGLPFSTLVLGVEVMLERVEMTNDDRIVAVCRRGGSRQRIGILDLPVPIRRPRGPCGSRPTDDGHVVVGPMSDGAVS